MKIKGVTDHGEGRGRGGPPTPSTLARRGHLIGIERCKLITLPNEQSLAQFFETHQVSDFNELRAVAEVIELKGVLDNRDSFKDVQGDTFKYQLPWPALQGKTGLNDGSVLDIMAPAKTGKTSYALQLMEYMFYRYNERSLYICFEMPAAELAMKTHILQVRIDGSSSSDDLGEQAGLKDDLGFMNKAAKLIAFNVAANEEMLKYDNFSPRSFEQVINRIRDAHRLYGVKWVCIDNLQLLNDSVSGAGDNMAQSFSVLSKMLINLAKELGIKIIRILQPKRLAAGQMATRNDTYGSSQLPVDCDLMLILHRSETTSSKSADAEDEWDGQTESGDALSMRAPLLVRISFTRHGSGGKAWLLFDGAAGLAVSPMKIAASGPQIVAVPVEEE